MPVRPTKAAIYRQFALYNAAYFDGRLMPPVIHWRRANYYGRWDPPAAHIPHGRIVLTTVRMPPCGWRGVLLHEMIHAQIGQLTDDDHEDTKVPYHGQLFADWCNMIGAQLGLPYVSVADCWAWPWACHFAEVEPVSER